METINKIIREMDKGNERWGQFKSLNEGWAVVEEALAQLCAEMTTVPRAKWDGGRIAARSLKLAAMAVKLYTYVTTGTYQPSKKDEE